MKTKWEGKAEQKLCIFLTMGIYKCSMITSLCVSKKMLPKDIKRYERKYLGFLQGENRKLHKISGDKNLTESVHRKISHTMRNSLAASCGFSGCAKLSFTQSCSQSYSRFSFWFRIAMRKCWLLDFFLWFSSLHLWLAWQPIAKLGKRAMKCSKARILHVFELRLALPWIAQNSPSFFACFNDQKATKN